MYFLQASAEKDKKKKHAADERNADWNADSKVQNCGRIQLADDGADNSEKKSSKNTVWLKKIKS